MTVYILHLEAKLTADRFYDVSVRGRPDLTMRKVAAADETEAMLRAASGLAISFAMQDQG